MPDSIIPSWLTSWVAWRNRYTEPGQEPFNLLKKELGVTDRLPTITDFLLHYEGDCPFCHESYVVRSQKHGLIYCICQVLEWQRQIELDFEEIRTKIASAKLSEVVYPQSMMGEARQRLRTVVETATAFIKAPHNSKWIIMAGMPGTGKTHIMRAINSSLYPIAIYITAGDIEDMTHSARKNDDMQSLVDLLKRAPVLLVDDLGMEYGGPLVRSVMDKIIDYRYELWPDYPLVVASNMRKEELQGYTLRSGDRFFDQEKTQFIGLVGTSFRSVNPELRK